jgi:hypothetical protein
MRSSPPVVSSEKVDSGEERGEKGGERTTGVIGGCTAALPLPFAPFDRPLLVAGVGVPAVAAEDAFVAARALCLGMLFAAVTRLSVTNSPVGE